MVDKALEIINQFNKDKIINKEIWLNMPNVWTFTEDSGRAGEKILVEPMIASFEKFNSNTGWTPNQPSPWIAVMQALSHYFRIIRPMARCCFATFKVVFTRMDM